ncbi:MAG: hypothetical protein R3D52_14365 [Xanthobacteraceae bacterium]
MIWAPLFAVTLVATVATGPVGDQFGPNTGARKGDALKSTVNAATECVVRTIAADPRTRQGNLDAIMGELIVDSMPACAGEMREMIDAYDASFGPGSGEAFFMGPYLDLLPIAATLRLKAGSQAP